MPTSPPDMGNWWPDEEAGAAEDAAACASRDNQRLYDATLDWVLDQKATFSDKDLERERGLTVEQRQSVVYWLVSQGVIEEVGTKRGTYRAIDRDGEVIDWRNPGAVEYLKVRWPLRLEERIGVLPGNIIVIAGESNAGKTAWMLAMAQMNHDDWPAIKYFASSNESSALTLRHRIDAFGLPENYWERFQAVRPYGEFADIIDPDGFNLVDYLEVHDDFYLVGKKLAAISERMKSGLCIVGLQKNPGSDYGRGGALTMDKASVYLSLNRGKVEENEPHTLKLPKVKYPLVDFACKPIRFKLAMGYNFVRVD